MNKEMKPKYNFLNNARYAFCGIYAMLKNEVAFRIELCIIIPAIFISFFLPINLFLHLLLIAVLFLIIIAECMNSAIEACVDLVTDIFHEKAKIAKDCASAGVFFSIFLSIITWGIVLLSLVI